MRCLQDFGDDEELVEGKTQSSSGENYARDRLRVFYLAASNHTK